MSKNGLATTKSTQAATFLFLRFVEEVKVSVSDVEANIDVDAILLTLSNCFF